MFYGNSLYQHTQKKKIIYYYSVVENIIEVEAQFRSLQIFLQMLPFLFNTQVNNEKQTLKQYNTNWLFNNFMPYSMRTPTQIDFNHNNPGQEQVKTQEGGALKFQLTQLKFEEGINGTSLSQFNQKKQLGQKQVIKAENYSENQQQASGSFYPKSKKKKVKNTKKKFDAVYYPNTQINGPQNKDRFLKKNVQYNILNQVFSFIWSQPKSRKYLLKHFKGADQKVALFYQYFKILKRGIRRIVNLDILKNFCNFTDPHPGFKTLSKKKAFLSVLSIEQFSSGVRFISNLYLRKMCTLAILTSKKMRKQIWIRHFKKIRQIILYLFYEYNEQLEPESEQNEDIVCKQEAFSSQ